MPDTQLSDPKAAWLRNVLGIDIGTTPSVPGDGMAGWKAARANAIGVLKSVEAEMAKMDFVDAPEAIILLRAIAANLTEEPTTPQQIAELRRYLEEDDIIDDAEDPNGFGIEVSLREPLLAALDALDGASPR